MAPSGAATGRLPRWPDAGGQYRGTARSKPTRWCGKGASARTHQLLAQGEGTREGQPFRATHLFLTGLRTTPEALLRLVRDRWSLEGWHWIRDAQLEEDAHLYRGNGAGALATLRTAVLNLLRLNGFQSIRAGVQAVCRDITALLVMARRQPEAKPC